MQSYDRTFAAKENSESAENQSLPAEYSAQIKVNNIDQIDRGKVAQADKGLKPIVKAPLPWEFGCPALLNPCQPRVHQQTEILERSKEPAHGEDTNPTSRMFSAKLRAKPQQRSGINPQPSHYGGVSKVRGNKSCQRDLVAAHRMM